MKEVEVKAKISNFAKIKKKLSDLGCSFSEPLLQKDKIYIHNSMKFSEMKKGTIKLRIRDSNGKYIFTLKKQLENKFDNIEHEMIIDNPKQGEDILKHLDFYEAVNVTKKRITCKYNEYEVCFDEVEELGSFIEVEKLTNEEDSLKVQEELFKFLETLGIKKENRVFKGYATLIYESNIKKEIN